MCLPAALVNGLDAFATTVGEFKTKAKAVARQLRQMSLNGSGDIAV
jgi:hypothetical protein